MDSLISIQNVTVMYDQVKALENITFEVNKGEYVAIMGPNGGGKSTLLKAILGLIPVQTGKILFDGKPLNKSNIISYVPQFADIDRNFPISAIEVVMTSNIKNGVHPFFKYSKKNQSDASKKLQMVGLENLADRQISELSGGEFQRLLIARSLAVEPEILILDEPTASIDPKSRKLIYDLLGNMNSEKKMTILMVTHDLTAISSKVGQLACLNGKLVYHGEPKLTQDVVNHLYECPVDLIAHGIPHRVFKEHEEDIQK